MSTVKARPQDFAMFLEARLLAEANLDFPVMQQSNAPARAPRSLTSGLRFSLVARRHAGSHS
ncbi:hypothetical protein ACLKMY_00655 [Paraburkholderia mimosarum]|uniref:hypothetical protein n=1 Tax=Paraburkholderia mimosarum TaxID=312026 RepID=UPI0039C10743